MPPPAKSWGYVYIVRSIDRYKIGWSGDLRTIQSRLKRLHYINAYGISLVLILRSRRAHKIETELHERYAEKRHHGEWFSLDEGDLGDIKQRYFNEVYRTSILAEWNGKHEHLP